MPAQLSRTAVTKQREEDEVLKKLAKGKPLAASQLGVPPRRVRSMVDAEAKLIKRDGQAKLGTARKAVLYSLTAKGAKRAAKL